MAKIPWSPPERPPRSRVVYTPPSDQCSTCLGKGVLYQNASRMDDPTSGTEIKCWVCNGTGEQLPPPPDGDLHSDGSSIPWSG